MYPNLGKLGVVLIGFIMVSLFFVTLQKERLPSSKRITIAKEQIDSIKNNTTQIDLQIQKLHYGTDSLARSIAKEQQKAVLIKRKTNEKVTSIKSASTVQLYEFFSAYQTQDTTHRW